MGAPARDRLPGAGVSPGAGRAHGAERGHAVQLSRLRAPSPAADDSRRRRTPRPSGAAHGVQHLRRGARDEALHAGESPPAPAGRYVAVSHASSAGDVSERVRWHAGLDRRGARNPDLARPARRVVVAGVRPGLRALRVGGDRLLPGAVRGPVTRTRANVTWTSR